MTVSKEAADLIGLQAVAWLAAQDALLPVFLGSTGASEQDFRAGLQDPEFQGAVLDFIMMDDVWTQGFCAEHGLAPEMAMRARHALAGGGDLHWT